MADAEHPPAERVENKPAGDQLRPPPDEVGPIDAVDLLIEEARAAVTQEIDLLKALAAAGAVTGRNVTIFGIAIVLIALVAILTLAFGALLAIAEQLGFVAATVIVVSILLLAATCLALLLRRQINLFRAAARGDAP
jgi:hypothetical protein